MSYAQAEYCKSVLESPEHMEGDRFELLHRQAQAARFWSRLTRRPRRLLKLSDAQEAWQIGGRQVIGVRMTPIAAIRGSDGRAADFDAEFRPLSSATRQRWVKLAVAYGHGAGLPPVELVQVGDVYYVRNGHHRISVAKAFGQREIEAEVTVWEGSAAQKASATPEAMNRRLGRRLRLWAGERLLRAGAKLRDAALAEPRMTAR